MPPVRTLSLALAMVLAVAACGSPATSPVAAPIEAAPTTLPTGAPSTATPAPLAAASVNVAKEPVSYRTDPGDELAVLYAGESVSATLGTEIAVGDCGVAMLRWPAGPSSDVLSGTSVRLTLFDAGTRTIALEQTGGTARYTLSPRNAPASVSVGVGELAVSLSPEGADIVVGADDDGVVWVVAESGAAALRPAGAISDTTAAAISPVDLASEQVVAFVPGEGFTDVVPLDALSVDVWYGSLAACTNPRPLSAVAFRCEVTDDEVALASEAAPRARALGTLRKGARVPALARDAAGRWVEVAAGDPAVEGWVPAAALRCIRGTDALAVATPGASAPAKATGATPTAAPLAAATAVPAGAGTPAATAGREGGRSKATTAPAATGVSTQPPSGAEPTATECEGGTCVAPSEPTFTPRPPRTRQPPQPTSAPPEPTVAPPEPTSAPPEPTSAPPEPTSAPPEPTSAP